VNIKYGHIAGDGKKTFPNRKKNIFFSRKYGPLQVRISDVQMKSLIMGKWLIYNFWYNTVFYVDLKFEKSSNNIRILPCNYVVLGAGQFYT
jgi:hypothetical protein